MRKGHTNNPNGRPKGVPNKSTKELREFIQAFVEQNSSDLQKEFDKLEGVDKFRALERLLPYILPKMQSVAVEYTPEKPKETPIDYSKLKTSTLQDIIASQKQ